MRRVPIRNSLNPTKWEVCLTSFFDSETFLTFQTPECKADQGKSPRVIPNKKSSTTGAERCKTKTNNNNIVWKCNQYVRYIEKREKEIVDYRIVWIMRLPCNQQHHLAWGAGLGLAGRPSIPFPFWRGAARTCRAPWTAWTSCSSSATVRWCFWCLGRTCEGETSAIPAVISMNDISTFKPGSTYVFNKNAPNIKIHYQ